ncbi:MULTISPECIES: GT-D fold domain-containing protein [Bacillus cereus group]|uniref:GT-D fold domain-containing protein n=1 Tax=Bacillus cereus group TaxID=86661 RepID=UPI001F0CBDE7|nr:MULTISPECIES: hypothetical protein [Bacillus cereus group]MDA1880632.1 hypothetical protein [Bacillus cereus group sp. BY10-2LC]
MNIGLQIKSTIVKMRRSFYKYNGDKLNKEEANAFISKALLQENPSMITRLGSVELECLNEYIKGGKFSDSTLKKMRNNAGFFPSHPDNLKKFGELYTECLQDSDLIGIWYNKGEDKIINNFGKESKVCELRNLEPYYHLNPWSQSLKGKKVLVINPFVSTIAYQYENNRENIFENLNTLPEFNLFTLKAVQSISGNTDGFKDWFEALEYMKEEISSYKYDVAIIGAGAYGLPLAAHVKNEGKIAIHLGGATQILFGVKGKRWDNHPVISGLYNEYWTRPKENERPRNFNNVENGCYW